MDILKKFIIQNKPLSILFLIIIIISLIIFFTCYFTSVNCNNFTGGSTDDNISLNAMVNNGLLTDEQKMNEIKENIKKSHIKVKKHNNIYNNLLTNLSSNEEEIENAEANLEEAKNNLILSETNLSLKNSMILLKKNKNPKKKSLLEFNVALNKSKQYNIQTIISFHKTKQLRKNTLVSPKDNLFKNELLKSIEETIKYAQQSHLKAKNVYTLCISSDNPDIIKYKADLSSAKNISKDLEDNINNIKKRIEEKYKLQDSIKEKLQIQKTTTANTIIYNQQNPSQSTPIENIQEITKDIPKTTQPTNQEQITPENTIMDTITNIFNF